MSVPEPMLPSSKGEANIPTYLSDAFILVVALPIFSKKLLLIWVDALVENLRGK